MGHQETLGCGGMGSKLETGKLGLMALNDLKSLKVQRGYFFQVKSFKGVRWSLSFFPALKSCEVLLWSKFYFFLIQFLYIGYF